MKKAKSANYKQKLNHDSRGRGRRRRRGA